MTKTELKTDLYNTQGEKIGEVSLPTEIFGVKENPSLIAQAVRVYLSNQRMGTAHVKTRGEVSGGGRKPWKQKGTGRARQGSIRSPLWIKGGVAHGPVPKDWTLKMSKKMKKAALFSTLSTKYRSQKIKVLDVINFEKTKTKAAMQLLHKLGIEESTLIVLPRQDDKVYLSFRNLPQVETVVGNQINTYQVLNHVALLIVKDSLKLLEKTFLNQKIKEEK